MGKNLLYLFVLCLIALPAKAQGDFESINTGVANFLLISPDARSTGMGGAGVALSGNDNAIFYNAATVLADKERTGGATYTFTPWMRDFQSGYSMNSIGGYYKLDRRSALLGGFRYYNYPKIEVPGSETIRPREWVVDLGYTRELLTDFALSATMKYIHSDMGGESANAVAFDIGAFYKKSISGIQGASWAAGLNVSNMGSRLRYLNTKEMLPVVAKVGVSAELPFLSIHKVLVTADAGYRFVPEDVRAFNVSAGAEYVLMEHFMLRGGYHYGDKDKGDTNYATAGLGGAYRGLHLDFAWLFAESDSPLRNTFWISLGYSF